MIWSTVVRCCCCSIVVVVGGGGRVKVGGGVDRFPFFLFAVDPTRAVRPHYGEAGAGKTQLMFSLAVNAMTSDDPGKVVWIDTEGAFSAERMSEIAQAKGFQDPSEILENIAYMRAET